MPYSFQGIDTLSSALEAFQTQLDVTGQNISNVNTAGYSREQVKLTENPSTTVTYGATVQIGDGVGIDAVNRIRDQLLQASSVQSTSALNKANTQATQSQSVQSVVLDPNSNGLSSAINAFYNAWSGLAGNPSDANRLAVQQAGQKLADEVKSTYAGFATVSQQAGQQVSGLLKQAQSDTTKIADLNSQILKSQGMGAQASTLMDQRDQAVNDLASVMNVNVQQDPNGAYVVTSGNLILVNQSGAQTIPTQWNASTQSLSDGTTTYPISSGQIAGLFDTVNKVTAYQTSLDSMANQLRSSVNGAYAAAKTAAGSSGALFFNAGTGASTLDLDSTGLVGPPPVNGVKNDPTAIAIGSTGNAADAGIAQQISDSGNQSVAGLGNQTVSGFYNSLVGQIGQDAKNATNSQAVQQAINLQISKQVQSVSGVNIDDEMAKLIQFQRSYQAAAQTLSAMDQTNQNLLQYLGGR